MRVRAGCVRRRAEGVVHQLSHTPQVASTFNVPAGKDSLCTERISSSHFASLKDVDRFGQLPGAPGAAAEFTPDAPGLELGNGAFAGAAQPGMSPVGVLLGSGLVPSSVWL